jgi:hypothetical protein
MRLKSLFSAILMPLFLTSGVTYGMDGSGNPLSPNPGNEGGITGLHDVPRAIPAQDEMTVQRGLPPAAEFPSVIKDDDEEVVGRSTRLRTELARQSPCIGRGVVVRPRPAAQMRAVDGVPAPNRKVVEFDGRIVDIVTGGDSGSDDEGALPWRTTLLPGRNRGLGIPSFARRVSGDRGAESIIPMLPRRRARQTSVVNVSTPDETLFEVTPPDAPRGTRGKPNEKSHYERVPSSPPSDEGRGLEVAPAEQTWADVFHLPTDEIEKASRIAAAFGFRGTPRATLEFEIMDASSRFTIEILLRKRVGQSPITLLEAKSYFLAATSIVSGDGESIIQNTFDCAMNSTRVEILDRLLSHVQYDVINRVTFMVWHSERDDVFLDQRRWRYPHEIIGLLPYAIFKGAQPEVLLAIYRQGGELGRLFTLSPMAALDWEKTRLEAQDLGGRREEQIHKWMERKLQSGIRRLTKPELGDQKPSIQELQTALDYLVQPG